MNIPVSQHRTQIYLTGDQYQRVRYLAQTRNVSLATIIRDAIAHYTGGHQDDRQQTTFERDKDAFLKLAGLFHGPKNLARDHDQYWDD